MSDGAAAHIESPLSQRRRRIWTAAGCAVLVLAAVIVYSDSFHAPFVFDDSTVIQQAAAKQPWPVWHALIRPRPVVQATLALNYFIGGSDEVGYHVVNLCIHILAALALFGIIRRTLLQCRLPIADCRMMTEKGQSTAKTSGQEHLSVRSAVIPQHSAIGNRHSEIASGLAFCAALLWVVHPLQTEAVTYVIQRLESLMGLFYLLTLYCVTRSASSPKPLLWQAAAVAACALGMGSKEVMASAPVIVLLYDRSFIAGSFREALRRRRGLYLGLAATWLILVRSGVEAVSPHPLFAGFQLQVFTPFQYARSEPGVILHYLALAFWPAGLCLDYGWPVANGVGRIAPGAIVVGGLLAATVWALVRKPKWGFLGAWFFLILAPTSSVMPINDLAFEHRMYLPLAALSAGVVVASYLLGGRLMPYVAKSAAAAEPLGLVAAAVLIVAAAGALGTATYRRNAVYRTAISIWQDTTQKAPANPRAWTNLGWAMRRTGLSNEAVRCFDQALELKPDYADACVNRAFVFARIGRGDLAIRDYGKAIESSPGWSLAYNSRGKVYADAGRFEEAERDFNKAIELQPDYVIAYVNRGNARAAAGRLEEAIRDYDRAVALQPDFAEVYYNRATAYYDQKEYGKALADLEMCEELHGQVDPGFRAAVMQAAGRAK